jgi:hypothetical protein
MLHLGISVTAPARSMLNTTGWLFNSLQSPGIQRIKQKDNEGSPHELAGFVKIVNKDLDNNNPRSCSPSEVRL